MRIHIAAGIAAVAWVLLGFLAAPLPAATSDQIDAAINKAKIYLYSAQKKGNWETRQSPPPEPYIHQNPQAADGGQWGSQTAFAVSALLAAGDEPQDDKLAEPIRFLQQNVIKGVYALSAKAMIYPYLPPTVARRKSASLDAVKLIGAQLTFGPGRGLYGDLLIPSSTAPFTHSASFAAVAGIEACQRAGAEVSNEYWKRTQETWLADQDASGGWSLDRKKTSNNSFDLESTAAGLTALYLTQDHLRMASAAQCNGNISNPRIELGLDCLRGHLAEALTQSQNATAYGRALFALERLGDISGLKYFGSVNWYQAGANYLLAHQAGDGSWGQNIIDTSYALLFLSHSQTPVVLNKLRYNVGDKEGNWNQRPGDVRNVVDWISEKTEHVLDWQIVSLRAPLRDLHDAPILYLAGNESLAFDADQQEKLRQFCEEGGIIVGNADCASESFGNSFRSLGEKLFPAYEFRELPAEHPIYTDEQWQRSNWKTPPRVLALSNGIRELMVLMPSADPARAWQTRDAVSSEESFELADNLFLYATGKENLSRRAVGYLTYPDDNILPTREIKLARLQYDGNWDPEPAGWRRLAAVLHNTCDVALEPEPVKLGTGMLGSGNAVKVAHLTGTTRLKLDAVSQAELRTFVQSGGTLVVDAAGGSEDFAGAMEAQLGEMFGGDSADELKMPIPFDDALYQLPGHVIDEIHFRPFARKSLGAVHSPQIKAIRVAGREAVFFSREDLSAGLMGGGVDGIVGYEPSSATAIVRNILLFSSASSGDVHP